MPTATNNIEIVEWLAGFPGPDIDAGLENMDRWVGGLKAAMERSAAIAIQLAGLSAQLLSVDPEQRRKRLEERRGLLAEREAAGLDQAAVAGALFDSIDALSRAIATAMREERERLDAELTETESAYRAALARVKADPVEFRFRPDWPQRHAAYYKLAQQRQPYRDRLDSSAAMWRGPWRAFLDQVLAKEPAPVGLGGTYRRIQVNHADGSLSEQDRAAFISAYSHVPPAPDPEHR